MDHPTKLLHPGGVSGRATESRDRGLHPLAWVGRAGKGWLVGVFLRSFGRGLPITPSFEFIVSKQFADFGHVACAIRRPTATFPLHPIGEQVGLIALHAAESACRFIGDSQPYAPIHSPSLLDDPRHPPEGTACRFSFLRRGLGLDVRRLACSLAWAYTRFSTSRYPSRVSGKRSQSS